MSGWRDRESEMQVRARRINEWTVVCGTARGWPLDLLRCECRDPGCHALVAPTLCEYRAVRIHATRFIVAPDHEDPETERIVQEGSRYAVVESVTAEGVNQARTSYLGWRPPPSTSTRWRYRRHWRAER